MKRLKIGDHTRVVSPSSSIESIGGFEANVAAKKKLEALGFRLSFSEHYFENDIFDSAPIASRVADLEAAFANETVDAILTTIGGFNCNELLPYLDFDLIARNPKDFLRLFGHDRPAQCHLRQNRHANLYGPSLFQL
jgi:muramoyltetrapeptide carboxypeptidase